MQCDEKDPAPRWTNVVRYIERNKLHSSLFIDYPLDYHDQMSSIKFTHWCNRMAKDNPTIFVKLPSDASYANILLQSIYKTLGSVHQYNCETIRRKMQARYLKTGFPLTIMTKCMCPECTNYITITSKYPIFLCRNFSKPQHIKYKCFPRQLFCQKCKIAEKTSHHAPHHVPHLTNDAPHHVLHDLANCFANISIDPIANNPVDPSSDPMADQMTY